ncbi:hypothetical protein [Vreelandella utahensis]|uniref:hypothetical protein n=1 Tax=Vreelandella halophila TaxID=86177 RepID=UPI0009857BD9|nr:hypothetical protein [Halomonas utahensis]
MMKWNKILIRPAVLGGMVLVAGCLGSSSGGGEGAGSEQSEANTVSDHESAVSLASRSIWFDVSVEVFSIPMQAVALGHMGEEPIEWFFWRQLLAPEGVDTIAPEGGPVKPDCSEGSVDFADSSKSFEAVYTDCRIPAPDVTAPGIGGALMELGLDQPQVWNGTQRFERQLNTPDWKRVYAIEHDNMTFSVEGADTPFMVFDGGGMMVRYNAINDIEFEGSLRAGVLLPVLTNTKPNRSVNTKAPTELTFRDYTNVDVAWQPDGLEGTKVSGRMEVDIQATPPAEIPDNGWYGHWIVETKEPIRYAETETTDTNPIDGEVHITAEDGNTIKIAFEQSGFFLDGVFVSWERKKKFNEGEESIGRFVKENFPGS